MTSLPQNATPVNVASLAAVIAANATEPAASPMGETGPSEADLAWWAETSAFARRISGGIECHVPYCPPYDGWNVAFRPELAGKPMIPGPSRGPWVVIDPRDCCHSSWPTAERAREAVLDARAEATR